jgi:MerR family transcriptional regulator, light-induced transcriptional regulator
MNDAFSREGVARWLREHYLEALLQGDAGEAERIARDALDAGLSVADVYDRIVAPSMRRIGDLWAQGTIGVADEHLATQISHRVVALGAHLASVADRRRGARVLAAAVEGEHHVLGLEMASSLLEDAGYEVLLLGADVPVGQLGATVARHAPALVALAATMPHRARVLRESVSAVQTAAPKVGLILGGAVAEQRMAEAPRVAVSALADVVERADALRQQAGLN